MPTDATSAGKPVSSTGSAVQPPSTRAAEKDKGKGKQKEEAEEEEEEEEDDDDDDDEDMEEDEMEEEDDEELDTYDEIDPTVITSRRTRGVKVDYTSPEALRKAGFTEGDEGEEGEDSFNMEH